MSRDTYEGSCFCGAVKLRVKGVPAMMGYCHCEDCRHWSAGPVNAFSLFNPDDVEVTEGADKIATFAKTENSYRKWCNECGGHLFSEHPGMGLTDVYSAVIPSFTHRPSMHVFYGERVIDMDDDLPKHEGLPG